MHSSKFKDMKWGVWQGAGLACKHIYGVWGHAPQKILNLEVVLTEKTA